MGIEFGVLGEVEAHVDGVALDLGHARQRSVLAALLVDAGRPVRAEQLVDRVWGDGPPLRARAVLSTYLTRLRRALAPATGVAITRGPGGYALTTPPERVDLHRFRALVGRGEADRALALWRGEPFAGLSTPWFDRLRHTLQLERQAALAEQTDLRLRRGEHAVLVAELTDRAEQDPLDERLTGQLLLALYRAGRPAEALARYRVVRERLVEELGTEPGPELRELHRRILEADPGLSFAPGAATPRQLPAPPRVFTGREAELVQLSAAVADRGLVVVSGIGGIGKTALVLHWAHRNADRFPDGQLYADLRGFTPRREPLATTEVVRVFLEGLGVAADAVPVDPPARTALYRSLLADRRVLVVLDNALDAAHVEPLLPGGGRCAVVVTSRPRLPALVTAHSAASVPLGVLDGEASRALLTGELGSARVTAEPDAVAAMLRHCAGLPLALSVVAARAVTEPDVPLVDLAAELAVARLDALDAGEERGDLRAVFSWSYRNLGEDAARMFRALGLHAGRDCDVHAAAALAGVPVGAARRPLGELVRAHLVDRVGPDRYGMHDLVRTYAAELATPADDGPERLRAHYLSRVSAAMALVAPYEVAHEPPTEPVFGSAAEARAWLDVERANLVATAEQSAALGVPRFAGDLAARLYRYLDVGSHHVDALRLNRCALEVAHRHGDRVGETVALRHLGSVCRWLGHYAEALTHQREAVAVAAAQEDRGLECSALNSLAVTHLELGRPRQAAEHFERALDIALATGSRYAEGRVRNNLGRAYGELGRFDAALEEHRRSMATVADTGDRNLEGYVLADLGWLHDRLVRPEEARRHHLGALEIARQTGDMGLEAQVRNGLGEHLRLVGDAGGAAREHRHALRLALRTGGVSEQNRAHLGLAAATDDPDEARRHREAVQPLGDLPWDEP